MKQIQQGDQHALSDLYTHYGRPVYSLALRVLNHSGAAEEVTQEVFLRVWDQAEKWDPARGALITWLLTITRNRAIDHIRRNRRQPPVSETALDDMPLHASTPTPGGSAWTDGQLIRELMERLPEEQAQLIELAFFGGMTHSDLAETLDLPLGTVKTRLRLGLQKLRDWWQDANQNKT